MIWFDSALHVCGPGRCFTQMKPIDVWHAVLISWTRPLPIFPFAVLFWWWITSLACVSNYTNPKRNCIINGQRQCTSWRIICFYCCLSFWPSGEGKVNQKINLFTDWSTAHNVTASCKDVKNLSQEDFLDRKVCRRKSHILYKFYTNTPWLIRAPNGTRSATQTVARECSN